jgi:cell division protein FtsB
MSSENENEAASATPEKGKSAGSAASAKAGSKGEKMQKVVQYAIPAVTLVIAIAAAVFAMLAGNGSKASQEQLSKADAKIEALTASLAAAKGEVDQLKALVAQDRALREKVRKEQDELVARIVQNIVPIQTKLKLKPTLDEQLHQPMSVPVAAPEVTSHAATPAPAVAATNSDAKPSPQAQAVKKAIEQFNK